MEDLKQKLRRSGIKFEIGGFRPSSDPLESWFGKVLFCEQGESWPEQAGNPMHPLCQINLKNLPDRPDRLSDITFITIFIGPNELPVDTPNGENWCLRAYKNIESLVPLLQVETDSHIKPFQMRPTAFHDDFPCWEDVPFNLPKEIDENYFDLFENIPGFKLGGWPTLLQSEIFWAPWNEHPASPEFVFQIDSSEKAQWNWGDGGVGYFGRGTTPGKEDEWALSWQCY